METPLAMLAKPIFFHWELDPELNCNETILEICVLLYARNSGKLKVKFFHGLLVSGHMHKTKNLS